MTDSSSNILTRENILHLLRKIGSERQQSDENISAAEYNFRQPHYFDSEQLSGLSDFAGRFAAVLVETFSRFFNSPFEAKSASVSQHYAGIFSRNAADNADRYSLLFKDKHGNWAGTVSVPRQTAAEWLIMLLGESENQSDSPQILSHLEQSLLSDIICLFIRSLSLADSRCDFQPVQQLIDGPAGLDTEPADELCEITLEIKKPDSTDFKQAFFIIRSSLLAQVIGKTTQIRAELKPQETKKLITEHLNEIPVPVSVRLGLAYLTIEQIMSLQVDDCLLLNKKIDQPAELVLKGKKIFEGTLARSENKKAFVVT